MPRQRCCGLIADIPLCQKFMPERKGRVQAEDGVILYLEELEAIRLKDQKNLEQSECASAMGLTRPTFQRILQSARAKVALALVEGKTITIQGGHYTIMNRVFECVDCGTVWEVPPCSEGGKHGYEIPCPQCGSMKKMKLESGVKHACGGGSGQGHGHGHGGGCCGGH